MSSRVRTRGSFSHDQGRGVHSEGSDIASADDLGICFNMAETGRRTAGHTVLDHPQRNTTSGGSDSGAFSQTGQPSSTTRQRSQAQAIPKKPQDVVPAGAAAAHPGSQGSSGSGFISGIMTAGGDASLLSHTPPTNVGTSYELQHFGKRPRAGSISGRLRSASELEDKGLIDRHQKALLKDLIISGDEYLQAALDEYEKGNTEQLESMIRSGELMNRATSDIDLLEDLDLDFLTVDDHFGDSAHAAVAVHHHPGGATLSSSAPIPIPPHPVFPTREQASQMTASSTTTSSQIHHHPNMVSPPVYDDDGIGDLEFNAELFLPSSSSNPPNDSTLEQESATATTITDLTDQRFRSNSLAFGALLNENHASADSQVLYGRWMDRHDLPQSREGSGEIGGIGASLAQFGRSKSDSGLKLTKAQLAEEKRRLKREKREQKEREKAERKEKREREKKERAAARDSQERKERKSSNKGRERDSNDDEERKETPSGLGRPRSMSDPNLKTSLDENGLLTVERPEGWVGAYSPDSRKMRIERFLAKRDHRVWTKKVKYDVRKNFADSRLRVKGRFVKKEDEMLMRDLMSLT